MHSHSIAQVRINAVHVLRVRINGIDSQLQPLDTCNRERYIPLFQIARVKITYCRINIDTIFLMKYTLNILICFNKIASRSTVHFGLSKIDYIVSFVFLKRFYWPLFV